MNIFLLRFASILLYTIPLKESLAFGSNFIYNSYYITHTLYFLTFPINLIEQFLRYGALGGFSSLIIFILLYAGLVRNPSLPYFLRFNACQALLLKIALIICTYVLQIFQLTQFGFVLFVLVLAIFIFSFIQCLLGSEPEIPFISKSVRMQI